MILQAQTELFDGVTQAQFAWTAAGFIAAITVGAITCGVIVVARKYDRTGGLLTISILIVQGFITGTFGAMLYNIQQNPITEILVGALATSMGAVVAHWSGGVRTPKASANTDVDTETNTSTGARANGSDRLE